jgi:hypothetical protein
MARVQETETYLASEGGPTYGQWNSPNQVPLRVTLGEVIIMGSSSRNRVAVSVVEDPSLASTDEGHTVNVVSVPPHTATSITGASDEGQRLTVWAHEGCQSIEVGLPAGAVQSHEAVGDASLTEGPAGDLEGHLPPHLRGAEGEILDRITLHLGGIAASPAA